MSNNSKAHSGSTRVPGVIVSEMVAPVRFRRKVAAVAGAFVVVHPRRQAVPEHRQKRRQRRRSPHRRRQPPHPHTITCRGGHLEAEQHGDREGQCELQKFDPKNFGEPIGDLNKWYPLVPGTQTLAETVP